MIRKILFLTSTVGALAVAGAVLAQNPAPPSPPRQMPPAPQTMPTPPSGEYAVGTSVMASDGARLGTIVRVHLGAAGQQMLHVRASDGTVKAAPTTGATVRDGTVVVAWTKAQFDAAAEASPPATDSTMPAPAPPTPGTLPVPVPPTSDDTPDASQPPVDPPAPPRD